MHMCMCVPLNLHSSSGNYLYLDQRQMFFFLFFFLQEGIFWLELLTHGDNKKHIEPGMVVQTHNPSI
jgi:hypothetical protein